MRQYINSFWVSKNVLAKSETCATVIKHQKATSKQAKLKDSSHQKL